MNTIVKQISERVNAAPPSMRLLDWLFGKEKQDVLAGMPVVLYGTGSLGKELLLALQLKGISPVCFCNSDSTKSGSLYCDLPIISLDELKASHKNSIILIATQSYAATVKKLLLDNGFMRERVKWPKDFDASSSLYFSLQTQMTIQGAVAGKSQDELVDILVENQEMARSVYDTLADQKSKDVLIAKLTFLICNDNISTFRDFMLTYSEPICLFGLTPYSENGPECYFYFTNDVYQIANDEVYVDVGAYDGDSVTAFSQACDSQRIAYKNIYAFEPDPGNFVTLSENVCNLRNVSLNQLGVWSSSTELNFTSSNNTFLAAASAIGIDGDIKIRTVSLDDFLGEEKVTLIKMDPPGNVIPEALNGALRTISKWRPKLVLGAYHSFISVFEIPYLVNSMWPGYKFYLRHNSWGCNETDLYAIPA
ncbi:MAG TPA: FkbM family methyltransferase [Syntrophobacteraceae bacterium]|nr:FkbM family methyltransferase [Syntrophobacteraceae bacterium]